MSAADFVANYAPTAIQDNALVKPDADGKRKWASKPEFLTKTQEALEAAGKVVVRTEPA